MLLAFADVQGHRSALESLLQSAKRRKVAEVVCLGNLAGDGPDNAGTVELARKKGVLLVAGPQDKAALKSMPLPAADLAYLRHASAPRRLAAGPRQVLLTSDAAATDPRALVLRPGADAGPNVVGVGSVRASAGEARYALLDLATGAVRTEIAVWDAPNPAR